MAKVNKLAELLDPIVTSLREVGPGLEAVGTQLAKAKDEILASLGDVEIPAEATAKIEALGTIATGLSTATAALKAASQALDDLNPDA